uniref:Uncharacterized protein n=1 Tax=Strigamia maritima TaxID=126957 RepID=T1JKD1_STRMM
MMSPSLVLLSGRSQLCAVRFPSSAVCVLYNKDFGRDFLAYCVRSVVQTIKFAECHFGGKTYELEDTWHPDLGHPFGVMYCVRCECMMVSEDNFFSFFDIFWGKRVE